MKKYPEGIIGNEFKGNHPIRAEHLLSVGFSKGVQQKQKNTKNVDMSTFMHISSFMMKTPLKKKLAGVAQKIY